MELICKSSWADDFLRIDWLACLFPLKPVRFLGRHCVKKGAVSKIFKENRLSSLQEGTWKRTSHTQCTLHLHLYMSAVFSCLLLQMGCSQGSPVNFSSRFQPLSPPAILSLSLSVSLCLCLSLPPSTFLPLPLCPASTFFCLLNLSIQLYCYIW